MHIQQPRRILLVNPKTPITYWGFQFALPFTGSRSAHIPLPLVTLAAFLPRDWEVRLVDMNVQRLRENDLRWADAVLLTGMIIQKASMTDVIRRCAAINLPCIVGGPFVSSSPDAPELQGATTLVIGEAEDDAMLGTLLADLAAGTLAPRYASTVKPALKQSPTPRHDLLKRSAYVAMAMQFSRGCPYRCEFCNIYQLFGRHPRYKDPAQIIAELESIHRTGFRGNVFVVDDNIIGDPRAARPILAAIEAWQRDHGRPFLFYTQADVRLAQDDGLIEAMVNAGFFAVFLGLESPSEEALRETAKLQNLRFDPVDAVAHLRHKGLLVYSGFIVGFDADRPNIFERLRLFIERCKIDFAMPGLLVAIPGTALETRLRTEGRLTDDDIDTFVETNIVPKGMSRLELIRGFRRLLTQVYSPRAYFNRAFAALLEWKQGKTRRISLREWLAVPRSLVRQGVFSRYSLFYWWFLIRTFFRCPNKLARAFTAAISGHHFFRYTRKAVLPRLRVAEARLAGLLPPVSESAGS